MPRGSMETGLSMDSTEMGLAMDSVAKTATRKSKTDCIFVLEIVDYGCNFFG